MSATIPFRCHDTRQELQGVRHIRSADTARDLIVRSAGAVWRRVHGSRRKVVQRWLQSFVYSGARDLCLGHELISDL